jgi:hypothetical protein
MIRYWTPPSPTAHACTLVAFLLNYCMYWLRPGHRKSEGVGICSETSQCCFTVKFLAMTDSPLLNSYSQCNSHWETKQSITHTHVITLALRYRKRINQPFNNDSSVEGITIKLLNSVAWVRELTIPTEQPPFVREVSAIFWGWRVPCGERDGSLRPYRFSRPEPLLFISSSASVVLMRLSGPRYRPTTSQKIW